MSEQMVERSDYRVTWVLGWSSMMLYIFSMGHWMKIPCQVFLCVSLLFVSSCTDDDEVNGNDDDVGHDDDTGDDDSSDCVVRWAVAAGGSGLDGGIGVEQREDGSIVVVGTYEYTALFGEGTSSETQESSNGVTDIFIVEYDSDGVLSWIRSVGGEGFDGATDVKITNDGSLIICGSTSDGAIFGYGEPSELVIDTFGDSDLFLARYRDDGEFQWVSTAGGKGLLFLIPYDLSLMEDGSYIVVGCGRGEIGSAVTFGTGEINETTWSIAGESDGFVARYFEDGTLAWVKNFGSGDFDYATGVSVLSDGSIIVTGSYTDDTIFGEGEPAETLLEGNGDNTIFIAQYGQEGNLVWAKRIVGPETELTSGSLAVFEDDTFAIAGSFGSMEGGPSIATFGEEEAQETTLESSDGMDFFIARYGDNGTLMWVKQASGVGNEYDSSLDIGPGDVITVTGAFDGDILFDVNGEGELSLESSGELDIFTARYLGDGELLWACKAGGPSTDQSQDISLKADGSFILTGVQSGNAIFGNTSENMVMLPSYGSWDMFIASYGTSKYGVSN